MTKEPSVTGYDRYRVRDSIVAAFKKHRGEATPADIVAFTGLPKAQIDAELPAVADEYDGRLKVTGSGQILYSFPTGFRSRYRGFGPAAGRFARSAVRVLASVGKAMFKAWIMVMLVGYFVLFIALAVLAVVASIAASSSDKNNRRSGRGGLSLTTGLFDLFIRIWFYNEVFSTPEERYYRGVAQRQARGRQKGNRRPLHKAIFSFVFGEPDPDAGHEANQKRAFVTMVRQKNGIIVPEEFMALTGLPPAEADRAINRYLYEFEGIPDVTSAGTVVYRFPGLLLRARGDEAGAADAPFRSLVPFSANDRKSNTWYAVINGVNLVFGGYFLYCTMAYETLAAQPISLGTYLFWFTGHLLDQFVANPLGVMGVGLGLVPLAFSALFWLIPALRAGSVRKRNERVKAENLRRVVYSGALARPLHVIPPDPASLPVMARPSDSSEAGKAVEELAAYEGGEPQADGSWKLVELERKLADARAARADVRPDAADLGGVVFDSHA